MNVLLLCGLLYIILTFGILLPKKLAARVYEKWSYACITPVYYITLILKPLTGLVSLTVKGILFLFGVRTDKNESDVTEEEIINMVNEGHEQGIIQASEAEMISNIFEYGEKEAQDIMTHRKKINAIDGKFLFSDGELRLRLYDVLEYTVHIDAVSDECVERYENEKREIREAVVRDVDEVDTSAL